MAVISCLIRYEVGNIVATDKLELNSLSSSPLDIDENIYRQAAHAYHSLYRGTSDEIVVKQSGDRSLTGRIGVITQFTSQHARSDGRFLVRLSTTNVKLPSRYCGYKCSVDPKFLEPKSFSCTSSTSRPNFHPVVIMYINSNGDVKHISFLLRRDIVDLVIKSIPSGSEPSQSHISMFMMSIGKNFQGLELVRLNEHPASTTKMPVSPFFSHPVMIQRYQSMSPGLFAVVIISPRVSCLSMWFHPSRHPFESVSIMTIYPFLSSILDACTRNQYWSNVLVIKA